ncbi:hypothetical protein [Ochrobactrum teleogrylli]|uniref:EthD domain-containing protein n=1 Tax=Ochrobactrum teleogrylli TaxID=2479765 RepID=A0ABD5K0C9_9HYPH
MKIDAVLFSEMTPDLSWEDEFNAWYDTHHIPIRMNAPGFVGAQRYQNTETGGYLAVYDMRSPGALKTSEYTEIKANPSEQTAWMLKNVKGFTRHTGKLLSWQLQQGISDAQFLASPFLYAVMFTVPESREREFNDWYVQDHVPHLLNCDAWLGCRRYRIVDGHPERYTHLALHHLQDLSALESPAREVARKTPWRNELAKEPWFKGQYLVFARHGERFNAADSHPSAA